MLKGAPVVSVLTRLDAFLRTKTIRHMVAQKKDRLDFGEIMVGLGHAGVDRVVMGAGHLDDLAERGEGFESLGHLCGLPLGDLAEELQGQVDVLRELRPNVCLTQGGSGAKCRLPFPQGDVDLLRHLDGDKRAHEFGVRDGMRLKMPIEGFLGRTVANQRSST